MPNFEAERPLEVKQLKNRLAEIEATVYSQRTPIQGLRVCVTGTGKGPECIPAKGWKPFSVGEEWGGFDVTTWFHLPARVPKAMAGREVVALVRTTYRPRLDGFNWLTEGGEALAYVNGAPHQGYDRNHEVLHLGKKGKAGEVFDIHLEATPSVRLDTRHRFSWADLAVFNREVWDFYWDCTVLLEVYETLDSNFAPARKIFDLVSAAVHAVDLQHAGQDAYYASIRAAGKAMRKGKEKLAPSVGMGQLVLTGHSHIDTAWLWPLRETRRKVGRTFSTVLNLMDRHPDFYFSFSQPELYMYCKEHYPALWKRLKQRVIEGRWEPCGAPWVEQDNNMTGGESFIRQFLYGNRFFQKEFGMRSRTAWLPDAFGYAWSMPQILRGCQIDTFVTTKIDWGSYTQFPYSFFQWQGADGTRIYTVMPPLNYNGNPVPGDLVKQWNLFKQKERVDELIFPIGWGDGGGGPTDEMIEHGRRLGDMPGIPKARFGRTQDSLDRMKKQCDTSKLPVYNNELYLELHRGCQTTQARTKRNNRKAEVALRNAEFFASWAHILGHKYDAENLWRAWRTVLTNQFHDILPGSSITEVYTQADKDYAEAMGRIAGVQDAAIGALAKYIETEGEGRAIIVFNTLSWLRDDVAEVNVSLPQGAWHVQSPDGTVVPSQKIGADRVIFEARNIPPMGYAVYRLVPGKAECDLPLALNASNDSLENDFIELKFDKFGRVTKWLCKENGRNVLPKGEKANVLQLFDDRPHDHDAWEIDHNFDEHGFWEPGAATEMRVIENGPVRAVLRVKRNTEKSVITQVITMYAQHGRVDFHTTVDWHEKRALLKAAFPVDVLSTRATYHIPFATIERATHSNTAHDRARFEVAGHYWADLSEGNFGVSLLNDCKYGYDVRGNVMRISLLRAPVMPDPHADEGMHEMCYSVCTHHGNWRGGTVQHGYELNHPLIAHIPAKAGNGDLPEEFSFVEIEGESAIIEHVKKAEDSDALIFRVYEAYGQKDSAGLQFGVVPRKISACDMMEENAKVLQKKEEIYGCELALSPYQIQTLSIEY